MKTLYPLWLILFSLLCSNTIEAQCPTGQVNVEIQVTTDDWGYEIFWDITPAGNACGVGALFTFGNTAEIDCNGAGMGVANSGGYGDNVTVTELIGCLNTGACFDIHFVDDYGDGGADFVVIQNGIPSHYFMTIGTFTADSTFSFCAAIPPVSDAGLSKFKPTYTQIPLAQANNIVSQATISSLGSGNITGVKLDIEVKKLGSTVYTATSTPQNLNSLSSGTFNVPPYTPTSTGTYTITGTATLDQTDEVLSNNVVSYTIEITDSVYARDNGVADDFIFVGAQGALANVFDIYNATASTSISQYIGNTDGSITGLSLSMAIYNCDALGTPTTLLATTLPKTITTTTGTWYTFPFSNSVSLSPGKYAFAALEPATHFLSLGYGAVFAPMASFVFATGAIPWSAVEDYNFFSVFMIRANLNSNLGVNELEQFSISVYPNPATNQITLPNVEIGSSIEIFNSLGQLVLKQEAKNSSHNIDISTLDNGIYSIRTISKTKTGSARFIKN